MMAEQEGESEEQEPPREMTAEEQKAMWSTGGSNIAPSQPYGGFSSGMSGMPEGSPSASSIEIGDEVAELLSPATQADGSAAPSAADELLSAFEDDEPPIDLEEGVVEYKFDEEPDTKTENWSPAEDATDPSEDRKVRQACSSCEKLFELELPEGVNSAKTACPHCGSVERVSIG